MVVRELGFVFLRLLRDDRGQDLIEYGLIMAIIGLAGWLLFPGIAFRIANAFTTWGTNADNIAFPPDPS